MVIKKININLMCNYFFVATSGMRTNHHLNPLRNLPEVLEAIVASVHHICERFDANGESKDWHDELRRILNDMNELQERLLLAPAHLEPRKVDEFVENSSFLVGNQCTNDARCNDLRYTHESCKGIFFKKSVYIQN
jgi:hypothetical protein